MRLANLSNRLVLVHGDRALDVAHASNGVFDSDPQRAFERWDDLTEWAAGVEVSTHADALEYDDSELGAPSPRPTQVICVGLNYVDHAAESGLPLPTEPIVFTKFSSAVCGPHARVRLPGQTVDWEAELVLVVGAGGRAIPVGDALSRLAGYTVGQDLSERTVQWRGTPAQFSLGKSYENFAPIGPVVATLDEFEDPDQLSISTTIVDVDGSERRVQDGSTRDLVFGVPDLVSRLSSVIELLPGDLIFTGTPAGVGMGFEPPQYLVEGQKLVTTIEGIGSIVQFFTR